MPELPILHTTREEWLHEAARQFAALYDTAGHPLPSRLHISCGLPSRGAFSKTRKVLGQCWAPEASTDGRHQIFISPVIEDELGALGTLLHELAHAVLPPTSGHGPAFKALCGKLGLTEGPAKSASPGKELTSRCNEVILKVLGKYPNAALVPPEKDAKTQTTRMLKISCSDGHEEYVLRGSRKVIALGVPDCPVCGAEMKTPEGEEE